MVLAGDHQGTMLGERGLEKETHIEKEKMCVTTLEKRFFFLSKILLFLIETTPGEADIYETSISNSNIFFSKP